MTVLSQLQEGPRPRDSITHGLRMRRRPPAIAGKRQESFQLPFFLNKITAS